MSVGELSLEEMAVSLLEEKGLGNLILEKGDDDCGGVEERCNWVII